MKARIITGIALATALSVFGETAKKGSCISKAIALKSSQTATLVNEYDSEEKEFYDTGVAYYTMTLKRGVAYTVWITGGNAANIELDVDTHETYYEDREDEPGASFTIDEINGGATKVAYLYAEDWDTEADGDPATGKYQVTLSGDIGASTTLGFQTGIRTFTVVGTEESPKVLTMSTTLRTYSSKLVDGEFHFRASLTAGRKYRIRTVGGTSANNLTLSTGGVDPNYDGMESTDEARLVNNYNDAVVFVPDTTGKYEFIVDGTGSQSFKFQYQMVPTRKITAHPTIPLLEENGYSASFIPGRIADTQNYYDPIVDENLCKIYLDKGERWTFETEGSTNDICMVAYDPSGKVLGVNETIDGDDKDTRLVITADAAGIYYIGVYNPALDVNDVPVGAPVILTARNTSSFSVVDAYDPMDDNYATASLVTPYPATSNDTAVAYTLEREDAESLGAIHGPHRFNAADFYDVFAFPCRKGYTYKLRAAFADTNEVTKLVLGAKVFNILKGKEREVAYSGTISPAYGENAVEDDLTFTAGTNAIHYLRVWVNDGKGLDFPAYNIHAIVANGVNALGLVKVVSRGAEGTWSMNGEKFAYPSGAMVAVAPTTALKVKANAVSGFKTPADKTVVVPAFTDISKATVVTNDYSDIYDSKYQMGAKKTYSPDSGDNTAAGAFEIVPQSAVTTLRRTLWTADPSDHFTFMAEANVYYNFLVESTLDDGSGDATIILSNAVSGVVYKGGTEILRKTLPVGKTYLIVMHGTDKKVNSAYALSFSSVAVGVVRFTNAKGTRVSSYTVLEGSDYATLYLQRTGGSEGFIRVRYATQAGTAVPGTNYYPVVTNEISWAVGDKAVKPIKIRLVPDAVEQWKTLGTTFKVRLYPVDEYDLEDGEYLSIVSGDTATVNIKESSAKKPGTVSLVSYGADMVVPNVKKPVVTGKAGEIVTLVFSRTDGTDGPVSVKVASPTAAAAKKNKDTAFAGTDYEQFVETLKWAHGEGGEKTVAVTLRPSVGYVTSKKFNFTIAAVKTDGTLPTLSAKTATLTILNGSVAQTSAAYAKTIPASTGLKLTSTGTWFNDHDSIFRSGSANGTLTYTLTGPGLFTCEPTIVKSSEAATATLKCQIANKAAKLSETISDFSSRLVRMIPAGTTTVKFTLSGVKGGAYVKFTPQADGKPYGWTKFAAIAPSWPMNKAVVKKDLTKLAWALPDALAGETGLYCRVRFGTTVKPTAVIHYDATRTGETELPDDILAGKTYYWALDYAYADAVDPTVENLSALKWTPSPSIWSFSVLKTGAPVTVVRSSCEDAAGNKVADLVAKGQPVELIQCVQPNFDIDGEGEGDNGLLANKFRLVGGALPKGMSINASTGALSGAPVTPGLYTALLQSYNETSKGKKSVATYGTTIPVTFNVLPAGTMLGSFRGVLQEAGELTLDARRLGMLTITTKVNAKKATCEITAKATIGATAYTFTGTKGFDELLERNENLAGCTRKVQVKLQTTVKTLNSKKKVTGTYKDNYLTLTLGDGTLTNAVALAEAAGTAELKLNVLNAAKTAVESDIRYTANLYRSNGGTEFGAAALAGFSGYYTAALAPEGISVYDGVPAGNGYLTFTVGNNGSVKVVGCLADGTAISFSTIGQLVGDTLADPRNCTLTIPVFAGTTAYVFGGDVKISFPADGEYAVVLPSGKLVWEKNSAKTTSYDGTAFAISLAPTGGWYDKIINLRSYYLGREFAISTVEGANVLPAGALASGYSFSTLSSPNDLEVVFSGNTMTVEARALVKNKTTGLTDFGTSVNPWNTTVKFTRATGIVTGTFNAWEWVVKSDLANEYATAQKQITNLAHRGVLLFARDGSPESPLADNVLTAGFFLMPATSSTKAKVIEAAWKASLPFNILIVNDGDKVWDEKEF